MGIRGRNVPEAPLMENHAMRIVEPAFGLTEWSKIERVEKTADGGQVFWRTQQFGELRVRMVEYTAGYVSDHWCTKGHVLLCLEGELITELEDGRVFTLTPGISYQVADDAEPHRSTSPQGAVLFIVD